MNRMKVLKEINRALDELDYIQEELNDCEDVDDLKVEADNCVMTMRTVLYKLLNILGES